MNRLTQGPGGVTLSYDSYGRLHKTDGTSIVRMGYDGADLITEYNNGGSTILRRVACAELVSVSMVPAAMLLFQVCPRSGLCFEP